MSDAKEYMGKLSKRFLAVVLVICMLFQTCTYAPIVSAENVLGGEYIPNSTTGDGFITLNGVNIEHNTKLTDNGDGTYTIDSTFTSKPSRMDMSRDTLTAQKGIYPVSRDGWYLIDLWGGAGASVDGAGAGGDAGHVYSKVYLKKGQTLYYTLGTNGRATQKNHEGGGINGSGGGHGLVGSYTVGGGGGYSAIFLYEEGKFEDIYGDFDFTKDDISEADRTSKFIMIAGGGGGGGGTPDSNTSKKANGGRGGYIGATSGTVSGENVIAGTYFAGGNGQSSGNSTSYIGKGATNVPGRVSDSLLGITKSEAIPPDNWFGHVGGRGGAGGSGELRGGGGGSGYAGGSGGLMTSVLIASNVGGGGGGSSFIIGAVNEKNTDFTDISAVSSYITDTNPSETGGSLNITYIDSLDVSFLGDLTLENCFSPYTIPVIDGFVATNSDGTTVEYSWEPHYGEENHEKVSLKNVSLLDSSGKLGGSVNVVVRFTYSDGFMGGNHVPIFRHADGTSYICPITITTEIDSVAESVVMELGEECGNVNMPLRIEVHAHDLEANTPGTAFSASQMFVDHYVGIRDNLESYSYEYDFIKEIEPYHIDDIGGNHVFDGHTDDPYAVYVAPNTTSDYIVKMTVKIDNTVGVAKVGEPIACDKDGYVVITDISTINIPNSRNEQIGKFMVTYTKSAKYVEADNQYVYTLNLKSSTSKEHNITTETEGVNHVIDFDKNSVVEYEHTIEVTGWYLLQLWGGNGGAGGNSLFGSGSGGAGGSGGYIQGYVHLNKGDVVDIFMGVNGTDNSSKWTTVGVGGKHSKAALVTKNGDGTVTETVLMIAGGGGGGGHYNFANGYAGSSVTETVYGGTANPANEYAAYNGKNGSGRNGGAAGINYINTALVKTAIDDKDALDDSATQRFESAANADYQGGASKHGGGTVHVKCLQITDDGSEEVLNDLEKTLINFGLNFTVSKYFKVDEISFSNLDTSYSVQGMDFNYVRGTDTEINLSKICPNVNTYTSDNGNTHNANTEFDIIIKFSAVDGFMGGNDVPVFVDKLELTHLQKHDVGEVVTEKTERILLGENDSADHVNVGLAYTKPELEGNKLFYSSGDPDIEKSALYSLISGTAPVAPSAEDEWLYEYVNIVNSVRVLGEETEAGDTLAPKVTTEYEVFVGIEPKSSSSKAKVSDVQVSQVANTNAIIIVGHEVIFELENLAHDMTDFHGKYVAEHDKDLEFTIIPDEGWNLPDAVEIQIMPVNGEGEPTTLVPGTDYKYVKGSGVITIYSSVITNDVVVRAKAKAPVYTLTFMYALSPDSGEYGEVSLDYERDSSIADAFHSEYNPEYEGYTFEWDWGDGVSDAPETMPARDVWVIGRFKPNSYTLTVTFTSEYGVDLPSDIVKTYKYGEQYVDAIPMVDGYFAYVDDVVSENVHGTMGAGNVNVTVEYRPSNGVFSVVHINAKTDEQLSAYSVNIGVGEPYVYNISENVPEGYAEGYTQGKTSNTPDQNWVTIEGTMAENGVQITVYWIPNSYEITFKDGEQVISSKNVLFDQTYGYDENGIYSEFPVPTKEHHVFKGWTVDGVAVDEESIVDKLENHDLVALWEAYEYTLTIKYVYEDGSKVFDEYKDTVSYGDSYSVNSPTKNGYDAQPPIVEGTMNGNDISVVVTYISLLPSDPVLSFTVSWGELDFNLIRGEWDPLTHSYKDDSFEPVSEGMNKIEVHNGDSYIVDKGEKNPISITATFEYSNSDNLDGANDGLSAHFTEDSVSGAKRVTDVEIEANTGKTVYVWMSGNFDPQDTGIYSVGKCTVTVSHGD